MGYYADGSGYIRFKKLSTEQREKVYAILEDYMEYSYRSDFSGKDGDVDTVDFWDTDKYHEDDILYVLNELADIATIEEGSIEYVGEDYTHWRFLFVRASGVRDRRGKWVFQAGRVVYDD